MFLTQGKADDPGGKPKIQWKSWERGDPRWKLKIKQDHPLTIILRCKLLAIKIPVDHPVLLHLKKSFYIHITSSKDSKLSVAKYHS